MTSKENKNATQFPRDKREIPHSLTLQSAAHHHRNRPHTGSCSSISRRTRQCKRIRNERRNCFCNSVTLVVENTKGV